MAMTPVSNFCHILSTILRAIVNFCTSYNAAHLNFQGSEEYYWTDNLTVFLRTQLCPLK